jgi:HEPN domain-containing protein
MSELDRARDVLAMADKDLAALGGMLDAQVFATEVFGFHAQQAIEKALKTWVLILGSDYRLTHNIITLLDQIADSEGDADRFWGLAKYNAFAVQFRYEEFGESGDGLDRATVVSEVSELVEHVRSLLADSEEADRSDSSGGTKNEREV